MASILDLSDELLLNVLDQIDDQRDAAHLAMCNRRLWAMGDIPMRRRFRRVRFAQGRLGTRIPKLLVEVLKKRQLGNYVRHIEVDCSRRHKFSGNLSRDGLDDADVNLLARAIHDAAIVEAGNQTILDPTNPNVFTLERRQSHVILDIFAALMASLSPRLTSIACCDLGFYNPKATFWEEGGEMMRNASPNPGSKSFFGRFILNAAKSRKYLQNIREVNFLSDTSHLADSRFYEEVDYYHGLNVIRRLPALKSVRWDASTDSEQHMSVRPPPRSASYSQLSFYHSTITSSILDHIIRSTKTLTHLTLTLGARSMLGGYFRPVELTALFDSLLLYQNTLEHLDIDADDEFYFDPNSLNTQSHDGDDEEERIEEAQCQEEFADEIETLEPVQPRDTSQRSLRNFHRLKLLASGHHTFCFWMRGRHIDPLDEDTFQIADSLPPTLQVLRLYGYGDAHEQSEQGGYTREQIKQQVSSLMKQKSARLPLLHTVEGLDEPIPNGRSVDHPDKNPDLLWQREIEEWSEEEDVKEEARDA